MLVWEAFVLIGLLAISFAYDIGTVSRYSYETTVVVNEKCEIQSDPQPVGHRLIADVRLTVIWQSQQNPVQKLIKIEIRNLKLLVSKKTSFVEHSSDLDNIPQGKSSYFLWEDGQSKEFWDDPNEHTTLRNLKRGIASILQFKTKDIETKENDVSGICDVIYKAEEKNIRKGKGNCVHSKFDKTLSQPHGIRSTSVHHQSTADYELQDKKNPIISKCTISEHVKSFCNAWHKPTLCVHSKSEFILEGIEKNQKTYEGKDAETVIEQLKKEKTQEGDLESGNIEAILVTQEEKNKDLISSISRYLSNLKTENLAQMKSAIAFYKLLPIIRTATSDEIMNVLETKKFEAIQPQLLDLISACSTETCWKVAFQFFRKEREYNEILERFVMTLSILPRPNAFLLEQIKIFLDRGDHDERIRASLLATFGTILRTYSENYQIADLQIADNFRIYLEKGLKKCDESDSCEMSYLRGLRNAARPRSVPVFYQYASQGGALALEAVLALRNIPNRLLPPENQKILLKIFNQIGAKQDRSTRAIAAELLLKQNPKQDVVKNILMVLSDQSDYEFSTFLAKKIIGMASEDKEFRTIIHKLLPEKDIAYYYSLAQEGQSSLFTKPMLSVQGTNVTYGLEIELLPGPMLKRSIFDISFENSAGGSNLISVGIFAEGLAAIVGADTSSQDESSSPTAGMEVGVLGSILRPYIFFRSTSELMGHVWSGTASELTPVFQGILAFSDDEKLLILNNGMTARGHLRGILSVESAVSVQVSIWNRNAQTLIKSEGALLVRAAVTVDAGFVSTQSTIQFSGESGTDFKIDSEFYEVPYTICLQMEHPDVDVKSDIHRSVTIPGTKYKLRKTKRRSIFIPRRSFVFHDKNSEMCRIMKSDDE